MAFIETSALDGRNVDIAFDKIIQEIYKIKRGNKSEIKGENRLINTVK